MRTLIGLILFGIVLVCACGEYRAGYESGYSDGIKEKSRYVTEAIWGLKRVQALREESEYERGKNSCR